MEESDAYKEESDAQKEASDAYKEESDAQKEASDAYKEAFQKENLECIDDTVIALAEEFSVEPESLPGIFWSIVWMRKTLIKIIMNGKTGKRL